MKNDIFGWLDFRETGESEVFQTKFAEHHIGNTFIRSIHGGVIGSLMEVSAIKLVLAEPDAQHDALVMTSSVDYLRVTKDQDLYCRAVVTRRSSRIRVVDACCWQDDEERPVAQGVITLRVLPLTG